MGRDMIAERRQKRTDLIRLGLESGIPQQLVATASNMALSIVQGGVHNPVYGLGAAIVAANGMKQVGLLSDVDAAAIKTGAAAWVISRTLADKIPGAPGQGSVQFDIPDVPAPRLLPAPAERDFGLFKVPKDPKEPLSEPLPISQPVAGPSPAAAAQAKRRKAAEVSAAPTPAQIAATAAVGTAITAGGVKTARGKGAGRRGAGRVERGAFA